MPLENTVCQTLVEEARDSASGDMLACQVFPVFLLWSIKSLNLFSHHHQVLRDQETQELLLCVAFVFEVSASERGAQHHIYRLGRD